MLEDNGDPRMSIPEISHTFASGMTGPIVAVFSLFITFLGGGLVKTVFDHMRNKRQQSDTVALDLVGTLGARVEKLEGDMARERVLCDAQLATQRHRINNITMLFDGLLMIFEAAPDKAAGYVAKIKERRAELEMAEATERSAVNAAKIMATAGKQSIAEE